MMFFFSRIPRVLFLLRHCSAVSGTLNFPRCHGILDSLATHPASLPMAPGSSSAPVGDEASAKSTSQCRQNAKSVV